MRSVSVREMRAALPRLEQLLEEEGEIVITRNGKPGARVLPSRSRLPIPSHAGLRSRMARLEVGSEVLIRQDRDER
jgi:antitoxin (DNA-binding transcriptional repressor) of toxin-antitoxin stability system